MLSEGCYSELRLRAIKCLNWLILWLIQLQKNSRIGRKKNVTIAVSTDCQNSSESVVSTV